MDNSELIAYFSGLKENIQKTLENIYIGYNYNISISSSSGRKESNHTVVISTEDIVLVEININFVIRGPGASLISPETLKPEKSIMYAILVKSTSSFRKDHLSLDSPVKTKEIQKSESFRGTIGEDEDYQKKIDKTVKEIIVWISDTTKKRIH